MKERVDTNDVLTFKLLDEAFGLIEVENVTIIFNKTDEDDEFNEVNEYYAEIIR